MEGFTKLPKMQHFKEGGTVKTKNMCYGGKMKKGGEVESADIAEDKKLIKKAFKQHDKAEHDKEPTEIKLRKGGRSKKAVGTVNKFKAGGSINNVYEAKKSSGDLDNIAKVKATTPAKATAKSAPVGKSKNTTAAFKCGSNVKKMADGGGIMDAISNAGTSLKNNVMGTPEQNRIAQARMDMIAKKKAAEQAALLGGLGGNAALNQGAMAGAQNQAPTPAPTAPAPAPGLSPMKRGGKAKKSC